MTDSMAKMKRWAGLKTPRTFFCGLFVRGRQIPKDRSEKFFVRSAYEFCILYKLDKRDDVHFGEI